MLTPPHLNTLVSSYGSSPVVHLPLVITLPLRRGLQVQMLTQVTKGPDCAPVVTFCAEYKEVPGQQGESCETSDLHWGHNMAAMENTFHTAA